MSGEISKHSILLIRQVYSRGWSIETSDDAWTAKPASMTNQNSRFFGQDWNQPPPSRAGNLVNNDISLTPCSHVSWSRVNPLSSRYLEYSSTTRCRTYVMCSVDSVATKATSVFVKAGLFMPACDIVQAIGTCTSANTQSAAPQQAETTPWRKRKRREVSKPVQVSPAWRNIFAPSGDQWRSSSLRSSSSIV